MKAAVVEPVDVLQGGELDVSLIGLYTPER
jgi:hypothetical protein